MANIDDFADEAKYTIKTVSIQTGIRPVTLRAWERRHKVLSPHRSDNRYRLYSDRDVAILRWLKSRVDSGVSISNAVAELHNMTDQSIYPEAIPTAPSQPSSKPSVPPTQLSLRLGAALLKHDEQAASDVLQEALSNFDLITVFAAVITPCLVEIGEAWYTGRIRIATEHFASAFLRGKLLSLLQAYPSRRNAAYILVGCAPTEQHELGSLMIAILLRNLGYRVEYLGPDIPIEDLVDYASDEHPDMILLSATTPPAALELKRLKENLLKIRPVPTFAYGGRAFDMNTKLIDQVPGVYLGNNYAAAIESLKNVLPRSGKKVPAAA